MDELEVALAPGCTLGVQCAVIVQLHAILLLVHLLRLPTVVVQNTVSGDLWDNIIMMLSSVELSLCRSKHHHVLRTPSDPK